MPDIAKRFFIYEAIEVNGTMKQLTEALNKINQDKQRQFVFMSNIIEYPNGEVGCIIQTRRFK